MKKQILFFGIFALFFVFAVQAANVQSQDINSADELKSYIVVVETKNYTKVMSVLNNETQNNVGIQQISSISQPKAISMLSDLKKKPNQQIKQLDIIHGFAAKMSARKAEDLRQQGYKVYLDRVFHILLQNSTIQVGANDAWLMMNTSGSNLTGNGSKIAIIDTGVNYTHPDLGNCITSCNNNDCNWSTCSKVDDGYNFVDNNNNSMDDNGHGTHCAGIAAADNGSMNGVKGVAPNAKLLAYKVCNNRGECQTSNIILAIQRAIEHDATVISISLGSNEIQAKGTIVNPDETLQEAIKNATNKGILVVVAAGNGGPGIGSINIISAGEDAIFVGAVNKLDNLASFTSIGPGITGINKPDLLAPGVNINSTCNKSYTSMSGTSMATPHVAGAVAILKQAHPEWNINQIKQALMFTAKDLEKRPIAQGSGRINISAAINNTIWTDKTYLHFTVLAGETKQTNLTITNNGSEQLNLSIFTSDDFSILRVDCLNVSDESNMSCNININSSSINLSNNIISTNSNQTINISVSLPENTTPGTYSGVLYLNTTSAVLPFTITVPAQPKVCINGVKNISFDSYVDNSALISNDRVYYTGDILHYPFFVEKNETNITIITSWINSSKDIDLYLKFPNGSYTNSTNPDTTSETINITNAAAGWYDIVINYWNGSGSENINTNLSLINEDCNCCCANCSDCEAKLNSSLCHQIVYLTNNTSASETCINNPANFNNKIFDCQGHTIEGDGSGYDQGIFLDSRQNNTIKNCIIRNFSYGIYLNSSSNNSLTNNTTNSNRYGIYLSSSSNNS